MSAIDAFCLEKVSSKNRNDKSGVALHRSGSPYPVSMSWMSCIGILVSIQRRSSSTCSASSVAESLSNARHLRYCFRNVTYASRAAESQGGEEEDGDDDISWLAAMQLSIHVSKPASTGCRALAKCVANGTVVKPPPSAARCTTVYEQ